MHSRLSRSLLYRKFTDFARMRPRVTVIAATVAAAGMLSTAGFAVSATASSQAGHSSAAGQQGEVFTLAGLARRDGSASSANTPAIANKHAKQQAAAAAAVKRVVAKQLSAKQRSAETQAAKAQRVKAERAKAQRAKAERAKAQRAKAQRAKAQRAKAAAAKRRAAAKPYLIYDSVSPGKIPAGRTAAVYANGKYAASRSHLGRHKRVLWIDVTGSDPSANVLDVEPGDASPAAAARWAKRRLSRDRHAVAIIYTMRSEWRQVKNHVATLPAWMRPKVRYWIADPTGHPHVVPGAHATQWYWGKSYDITTAKPNLLR